VDTGNLLTGVIIGLVLFVVAILVIQLFVGSIYARKQKRAIATMVADDLAAAKPDASPPVQSNQS
jgi:hypothetical protein